MPSLDHVVFPVRDAEASLRFYGDVMGFPLLNAFSGDDWDGYPWLMMVFGLGGRQELVCVALKGAPAPDYRGVPVDARHYALAAESAEAFSAWRAKLRAAQRLTAASDMTFSTLRSADGGQVISRITPSGSGK